MRLLIWFLLLQVTLPLPYAPFSKDVNVVASWSVTLMTDGRAHDLVGYAARRVVTFRPSALLTTEMNSVQAE